MTDTNFIQQAADIIDNEIARLQRIRDGLRPLQRAARHFEGLDDHDELSSEPRLRRHWRVNGNSDRFRPTKLDGTPVPSVNLLEIMADTTGPVTAGEISDVSGVPRREVVRHLFRWRARGWIENVTLSQFQKTAKFPKTPTRNGGGDVNEIKESP